MALDPRLVQLGIEIDGRLKLFKDISISATGVKFANGIQNEIEIKVTNLNRADREYILTESSPYNLDRTFKKVIIQVGRVSTGLTTLFVGDIITTDPSQPPDLTITIKAKTANFFRGNIITTTAGAVAKLSTIAQLVANDLNLSLRFEATDKNIANYSFTGAALKQVDKLGELGDLDAFIDDQLLIVKNKNVPLKNSLRKLDKNSIIGKIDMDIQGIRVKYFMDENSTLGSLIEIDSSVYPTASGTYTIYRLSFDIANRNTPWYWIAEAKRRIDRNG